VDLPRLGHTGSLATGIVQRGDDLAGGEPAATLI
jgi:hypothetical protein